MTPRYLALFELLKGLADRINPEPEDPEAQAGKGSEDPNPEDPIEQKK